MSLKDEGFRFTLRVGVNGTREWRWRHPAEMTEADNDCTDMTDAEFSEFVLNATWGVDCETAVKAKGGAA